jgi:hypothetical protein
MQAIIKKPHSKNHQRPHQLALWRLLLIAAVTIFTGSCSKSSDEQQSRVGAQIVGHFRYNKKPEQNSYKVMTYITHPVLASSGLPGGTAAFGILDNDQVVLMTYAKYLPALNIAYGKRDVSASQSPLTLSETPRFIMICVWTLNGEQASKPYIGYAEREDANAETRKDKFSTSLTAHWQTIPAKRAPAAFSKSDYCGEIAISGQSSAPLWLLEAKK